MTLMCNKSGDEEKMSVLSLLPEELALSCLVRVSRSDLESLSLVSKAYRTLVASPELYKMRTKLGYTCFYICITTGDDSSLRWFMLSREKTTNRLMTPIPRFPSTYRRGSSVVSLDWGIYVIGGLMNGKATSDVSLLDCRTHTWRHVPPMRVARVLPGSGVVGGKIYVFGGWHVKGDSSDWGEVFDPKTQTWEFFAPLPYSSKFSGLIPESLVLEDKIYGESGCYDSFYYYPLRGIWERSNNVIQPKIHSYCCVTEKLLYGCDFFGKVYWTESDKLEWKQVKGLEALRTIFPQEPIRKSPYELPDCSAKNYSQLRVFGVNIMLVWFIDRFCGKKEDIWCAEISMERRKEKGEVWGNIEWSQAVATLDDGPFSVVKAYYSASVNV